VLEGGNVQDVKQATAALIVLGGTIGAVMVTTPWQVLLRAVARLKSVFFDSSQEPSAIVEEIIHYAAIARKDGLVSLDAQADSIPDPFLRKALSLAVDGADLEAIRSVMELDISLMEEAGEAEARVYETAGGYAPTVGIIGAVLGLIQVMKNLANIDEVGRGIAVAFVATVYGVGSANLFFLPAAGKIKARLREAVQLKELMLQGVLSIAEGTNPKLIRTRLEAYIPQPAERKAAQKAARPPVKTASAET